MFPADPTLWTRMLCSKMATGEESVEDRDFRVLMEYAHGFMVSQVRVLVSRFQVDECSVMRVVLTGYLGCWMLSRLLSAQPLGC